MTHKMVAVCGIAVGTVMFPQASTAGALLAWATLAIWSLPNATAVMLPLFLLLAMPFDFIVGTDGSLLGMPVLVAAMLLATVATLKHGMTYSGRRDWDLITLLAVLGWSGLLHSASGQLRLLLFWVSAALFVLWVHSTRISRNELSFQIHMAVIGAGTATGLVAIADHLVGVGRSIPGYIPAALSFHDTLGMRSAGLSGHPLRCGSLCMLGAILALGYLVRDSTSRAERITYGAGLSLCLGGLVVSGARGAWLALVIGLGISLLIMTLRQRSASSRIVAVATGVAALVWVSGLGTIIYERMFGLAAHPGSLGQRLAALKGLGEVWRDAVLTGVGMGGAADITMRMGLVIPNLENEYLRFFLACGVAGPLALAVVCWRRLRQIHVSASPVEAAVLAATVALFMNIATYNTFSWSAGPILLFAIAYASKEREATQSLR